MSATARPAVSKEPSLARNLLSNVGGYVVSVIIGFVVAPVTIHNLGDSRYGAWILVSELIGYYGLLDLGIRGAVTYFVARTTAHNEETQAKEITASAFWVLTLSGAVVFVFGLVLAALFPILFRSKGLDLPEVRTVIVVMSTLIAIGLPMNIFSAVLIGHRRFDLSNANEIGSRLLAAILTYIAMRSGGTLISLCMIQAVARIQAWTVTLVLARRVAGYLGVHPSNFRWHRVRKLWGYGFRNFVGSIALLIIYRIDLTVVGAFIGVQWVTFYSLGASLANYASTAIMAIAFVFTPHFARLHSKDDHIGLMRSFFSGMRITGIAAATLSAGILVFGRSFLYLWVGTKYVSGPWAYRSDVIMALLVIAKLPTWMQSISWQLQYGTGRTRFLMWMSICEAIANIVLSIVLGRRYGPAGVALGTLIPAMISAIIALPAYVLRTFHIRPLTYFGQGMCRALGVGAGVALTGQALISYRPATSWAVFVSEVALSAAVGLCLSISIGITGEERSNLISRFGRPRAA